MRILFLSHYFPPEVNAPASRTFEHCREWVRAGHEVTVVTCAPNHPRGVLYPGYANRLWQEERRDGIRIIRLWTFIAANEGFALRTLNYVSFMIACIVAAPRLPKADVLLSTSPQFFNGLAGYFVSRLRRVPWALEIRDLWPESIVAVGGLRNRRAIALLERIESFAYRKADRIVPVTDAFKRHMVARGVDAQKIAVIKNGADMRLFDSGTAPGNLRRELALGERFVAGYFGTHGMAHRLDVVLQAAALLRARSDIVFLLVGDGAERARLVALRDSMGLENVLMLEQQPKQSMPKLWATIDASLVVLQRSPIFKTVIPSKIFESLAMERPVILGVDGESRELLQDAEAGVYVEPENAEALAAAVAGLAADRAGSAAMGKRGRRFVEEHFDRAVLARRYLEQLIPLREARATRAAERVQREAASR